MQTNRHFRILNLPYHFSISPDKFFFKCKSRTHFCLSFYKIFPILPISFIISITVTPNFGHKLKIIFFDTLRFSYRKYFTKYSLQFIDLNIKRQFSNFFPRGILCIYIKNSFQFKSIMQSICFEHRYIYLYFFFRIFFLQRKIKCILKHLIPQATYYLNNLHLSKYYLSISLFNSIVKS